VQIIKNGGLDFVKSKYREGGERRKKLRMKERRERCWNWLRNGGEGERREWGGGKAEEGGDKTEQILHMILSRIF